VHVRLLHESGFCPPPSPQQKRFEGLPLCLPRQSAGQETQSSPLPASQMPLPHRGPEFARQSFGQPLQFSPASHTPLLLHTTQLVQVE
jgi:hypothetical protein